MTISRDTPPEDVEARRAEARELLAELERAKAASERNLASLEQSDRMKQVTGRSSLENAIERAKRLLESYERIAVDNAGSRDAA